MKSLGATEHPDYHDELLIVRNSGEIPEVALHGAFYYLTSDPEGPGLTLTEEEQGQLKEMAVKRYREILLRDLTHANRRSRIFRGLARSFVNWQRVRLFCEKEKMETTELQQEVREAFLSFLREEAAVVAAGDQSTVNCTADELVAFARGLGIAREGLPVTWFDLCGRKE
ncbi:MAG: hypothetical protein KJ950_16910 [Proteobacteria bacterium]|nr:hypothetical protein [Pseudomonadota bacterium]MBU1688163.1 hypothetical protein [Pseudomonadota bacterium]